MTDPRGPSTGSDYVDAMKGVLERAADIETAKGRVIDAKPPFLTRPPVMVTLFVVLIGVALFNVRFYRRAPPPPPRAVAEASAQLSLMVASQVVEAYREENGELPESLGDVGLADDAFEYRRNGEDFELGTTVGTVQVRYDSRSGPQELLRDLGVPVGGIR